MFVQAISLALVAVLVHGSIAAQDQPTPPRQSADKMHQVLHKAQEKNKAVKVILHTKIGKRRKFSGKVSEISDTGFVVTDEKTGKTQRLDYADVREVQQKGWSTGTTIAVVVIAGVVFVAVIVAYRLTHLGD